jgi:hypothetical protein
MSILGGEDYISKELKQKRPWHVNAPIASVAGLKERGLDLIHPNQGALATVGRLGLGALGSVDETLKGTVGLLTGTKPLPPSDFVENNIRNLGGRDIYSGIGATLPDVAAIAGGELGLAKLVPSLASDIGALGPAISRGIIARSPRITEELASKVAAEFGTDAAGSLATEVAAGEAAQAAAPSMAGTIARGIGTEMGKAGIRSGIVGGALTTLKTGDPVEGAKAIPAWAAMGAIGHGIGAYKGIMKTPEAEVWLASKNSPAIVQDVADIRSTFTGMSDEQVIGAVAKRMGDAKAQGVSYDTLSKMERINPTRTIEGGTQPPSTRLPIENQTEAQLRGVPTGPIDPNTAVEPKPSLSDTIPQPEQGFTGPTRLYAQSGRAYTDFTKDGRAIITGLEGADFHDFMHETGHIFRRNLAPELLSKAETEFGVVNGKWTEAQEEDFANSYTNYLRTGKSPTPALENTFSKYRRWLSGIYDGVKDSTVDDKISPAMRDVFNRSFQGGGLINRLKSVADTVDANTPNIPLVKQFVGQDVVPGVKGALDTVGGVGGDIQKQLAPATRGDFAKRMGSSIQTKGGENAQKAVQFAAKIDEYQPDIQKLNEQQRYDFRSRMDDPKRGAQLTPRLQQAANLAKSELKKRQVIIDDLSGKKKMIWKEDYAPHLWENPDKAKEVFANYNLKRSLEGPKSFMKKRSIENFQDGIDLDLEPAKRFGNNPIEELKYKVAEMDRFIMGQEAFKEGKDAGYIVKVRHGVNPIGYANINDKIARAGKGGRWMAPEPAARVLNNYLSPGLEKSGIFQAARKSGNFMNQVQLGLSAFHLGFTSMDAAVSDFALGLQKVTRGDFSGFRNMAHGNIITAPIQTYLKGNKLLAEYTRPGTVGGDFIKIANEVTRGGGRVKMDDFYKNSSVESFWNALHSGNALGAGLRAMPAAIEWASRPIMEKIVPRMKLGVFFNLMKSEMEKGNWEALSEQAKRELAQRAWNSVDNRMGQLVYDNLFWNKTLKDIGFVSVRSLGWNIGTFRELGGAGLDFATQAKNAVTGKGFELTPRMAYAVALPTVVALHGAMFQYLMTGKGPTELKDYFFPKTGDKDAKGHEERVSLPSYMKDVYAYSKAPGTTLSHKMHPLITAAIGMIQNKDFYGTEIRHKDDPWVQQAKQGVEYAASQFVPFSLKNYGYSRNVGESPAKSAMSFMGITPAPKSVSNSPAENKMAEILAGKRSIAPRTRQEFNRSQEVGRLTNMKEHGTDISDAVQKDVQSGLFRPRDITKINNPPANTFESGMKYMTLEEALNVYDASDNPRERAQMRPIVLRKFGSVKNMNYLDAARMAKRKEQILKESNNG